MTLFEFAYCGTADLETKLSSLAEITGEDWSSSKGETYILKYYLQKTFEKVYDEGKVFEVENDDMQYAIFNTGLYTKLYDSIYCYFITNRSANPDKQKWYLDGFYTTYEMGRKRINPLPERADYFQDPSLLVYNANLPLRIQFSHILSDEENLKRLPSDLQNDKMLSTIFSGAIDIMKKRVTANYKLAVPQYFGGKIQLLLPLCLVDPEQADVALVVTKCDDYYQGHTCLTLEMAYSNARLITKPEINWLNIK